MARFYNYTGAASSRGGPSSPYHVMIATPVGVAPCCDYTRSLAATVETLSRADIRMEINLLHGHCHVDDARNLLIREFLQSECTDLFFIDADMGWQGNYVSRLLRHEGDIVAGVYCHKSDDGTYPFHPGGPVEPNEHGLYQMPKVATGFMRIRRHVLEALYRRENERGRLSRKGDELGNDLQSISGQNFLPVARIVERGFPKELGLEAEAGNDLYTSGDYVLSLKARQLGFKCFIDPDMEFSHSGEKVWRGHFGNAVRRNMGIWQPGFVDAVAALKSGPGWSESIARLVKHYGLPTDWPLAAEPLTELYEQARHSHLSGDVLEFGSGLSTLVLGLALAGTDRTVHALEHDALYFQQTSRMLQAFEVPNVILHYAPLVPQEDGTVAYGIGGSQGDTFTKVLLHMDGACGSTAFFDEDGLPSQFSLALLDGPPRRYGRLAAVKPFAQHLAGAVLVIDDAEQHGEMIDWLRANGHDVNIRPGTRWWAVAHPKAQAMLEAAE
jgi:predicted O-methyltransferase YrrM